jgi:hypothetical protein
MIRNKYDYTNLKYIFVVNQVGDIMSVFGPVVLTPTSE